MASNSMSQMHDADETRRALSTILAEGQVVELRALDAVTSNERRPHIVSGYFDNAEALVASLDSIKTAKGIYFTPNAVMPALLARAKNRARAAGRDPTTSDNDIERRHWLLIDCDPRRPAGISASDREHDLAIAKACTIRAALADRGWPEPILADSGNGGHLMFAIDQPADDGGLIHRCLQSLAAEFDDSNVTVDQTVYNPARIWKLPGTMTRKGDDTPERPHRMSKLIDRPDSLRAVSPEQLEALAAKSPVAAPTAKPQYIAGGSPAPFDVEGFIAKHFANARGPEAWQGGERWILPVCPWNPDHTGGCAVIIRQASGALVAKCHHNSCAGNDWRKLREMLEPTSSRANGYTPGIGSGHDSKSNSGNGTMPGPKKKPAIRVSSPWRPFPVELIPYPIGDYISAASRAMGCDPAAVALPMLAAAASAVGNSRVIRLKGAWCEPLVLWMCVVQESGSLKSPAQDAGLKPLRRRQTQAIIDHRAAKEQYATDLALHEADKREWQTKGRKTGEPPPVAPVEPVIARYIVSDTTVEALAERLTNAPRGLLLERDELAGWFGSFDKYSASGKGGGDVAHWLTMHRAGQLLVDRKLGRTTTFVPRAAVSICGGIQPGILATTLDRQYRDNGLAARLLFAMPPAKQKRWSEAGVAPDLERAVDRTFGRLAALQGIEDGTFIDPIEVDLAADAKRAWVQWYDQHAERMSELTGDLAAMASKIEAYAARLTLLVHLSSEAGGDKTIEFTGESEVLSPSPPIEESSVRAGCALADWFENEAERIYQDLSRTPEEKEIDSIQILVARISGDITPRKLQRCSRLYRDDVNLAEAALAKLVDAGLGTWKTVSTETSGGRPSLIFIPVTGDKTSPNPANDEVLSPEGAELGEFDAINAALAEAAEADQ